MMTINTGQRSKPFAQKLLIVIVGPTAIGKTGLSIRIAQHYHTAILSADSRQFYRELKIGTAAPTNEELTAVPHFFAGHLSMHDYYNVSRFESDALETLEKLFLDKNIAILSGGSGLYIDAVCKGIDDMPEPDEKIRIEIENWFQEKGIGFLCEKLASLDPEYFEIVDKANPNRLKRALEVCLETGKTYTSFRTRKFASRDFEMIKIGLNRPREELFQNISLRTDMMIKAGLVEEVKSLTPFRDLNALNTVGYKEIFDYLDGNVTLESAIENIKTNTRRYAKRQLTWFKRDKEIRWFLPEDFGEITRFIDSRKK